MEEVKKESILGETYSLKDKFVDKFCSFFSVKPEDISWEIITLDMEENKKYDFIIERDNDILIAEIDAIVHPIFGEFGYKVDSYEIIKVKKKENRSLPIDIPHSSDL